MKVLRIIAYSVFYLMITVFLAVLVLSWTVLPDLFTYSEKQIAEKYKDLPNKLREGKLSYADRDIFYMESGSDTLPMILFIHGSPGDWQNFMSQLSDPVLNVNYHLVACNRPGYASWDHGKAEITLQRQAEVLSGLFELNHSPHKPVLVGHSLGGPIICKMAMDYADKVGGLVIVAGSIDPEEEPNEFFRVVYHIWPLNLLFNGPLKASNEELYPVRKQLVDMLPEWDKITCPVTVVQGDADNLVPVGNAYFAEKNIRKSSHLDVRVVPGQDHFIPWEDPLSVNNAIMETVGLVLSTEY